MTTTLGRDDRFNCPACTHGRSEHHLTNPPRLMRYNPGEEFLGTSPKIRHSTPSCINCEKCLVEYALPDLGKGPDEAVWLAELVARSEDSESLNERFLMLTTLLDLLFWRVTPNDDDERFSWAAGLKVRVISIALEKQD